MYHIYIRGNVSFILEQYRNNMQFSKVVFCKGTYKQCPGIYPGYYPTYNFCKFCRTFIPVPGTSGCSVTPVPQYPGYGRTACFVPARNFCEFCTLVPQYPELLEVLYDFRTRTRNFWNFCKISVPLPGTSVTSVRLWHNTRGTGMYAFVAIPGELCIHSGLIRRVHSLYYKN